MKQAFIDKKDFNRMIQQMKKVINPNSWRPRDGLIQLEVWKGAMKCVATDGFRIHEVSIYAKTEDEFSCFIAVPRLKATDNVRLTLEDGYAYLDFDDVRFSTKQPQEEQQKFDFDVIRKMIADDERVEIAVNPKYLMDALQALSGEKSVILNVGKSPTKPIVIRANDQLHRELFGVLPVRSRFIGDEF